MKFKAPKSFYQEDPIRITVVGCGGNGVNIVNSLPAMHLSMLALGHPAGLAVDVYDDDIVTEANMGRQLYSPSDIGSSKAAVTVGRINSYYGVEWEAKCERFKHSHSDIIFGCVDSPESRRAIRHALHKHQIWIDLGNGQRSGQVIMGTHKEYDEQYRKDGEKPEPLPTVMDLFPDMAESKATNEPSCSLAGALTRQDLFINRAVSTAALNLFWQLWRHTEVDSHGAFVNLETGITTPLMIDPKVWLRMGYSTKPGLLRKITKVLKKRENKWDRDKVKLSCGHIAYTDALYQAAEKVARAKQPQYEYKGGKQVIIPPKAEAPKKPTEARCRLCRVKLEQKAMDAEVMIHYTTDGSVPTSCKVKR